MYKIEGKVAFITGGCSGIGLAYAKELLRNNAKGVAVLDLDEKIGYDVEKKLKNEYGEASAIFIKADVTKKHEVEEAFEKTVIFFNQLDIVINNAGILAEDDFEATVNINLLAPIRISKLAVNTFLPKYRSTEEGVIVNTASTAGVVYFPDTPVYSSTKHGLVAFAKISGEEYKKHKARIMTICPGPTNTPLMENLFQQNLPRYSNIFKLFDINKFQKAEAVAEGLIKILKEGESGSVWICDQKPVYEIALHNLIEY